MSIKAVMPLMEVAKDMLSFDQSTGEFTWRKAHKSSQHLIGRRAGSLNRGYTMIRLNKTPIYAHRLAWAWVHNEEPPAEIDHIDRNRLNNRPDNLRRGDNGGNRMNVPPRSATGITGVFWNESRGRFLASMGRNENLQRLYWGKDFFEACCARKSAEASFWRAAA